MYGGWDGQPPKAVALVEATPKSTTPAPPTATIKATSSVSLGGGSIPASASVQVGPTIKPSSSVSLPATAPVQAGPSVPRTKPKHEQTMRGTSASAMFGINTGGMSFSADASV